MAAENENGTEKTASFTAMKAVVEVPSVRAEAAVEFYKAAFGAEELRRSTNPKRKADQELPSLLSAELTIGSSAFVVSATDIDGADGSSPLKEGNIVFRLETDNVEAAVANAVKAGGVADGEIMESEGPCCGIYAKLKDPFGAVWIIASATVEAQ